MLRSHPRPANAGPLLPSLAPAAVAVGTIAYCSPEQLLGLKCGFASDIYSFGVVSLLAVDQE